MSITISRKRYFKASVGCVYVSVVNALLAFTIITGVYLRLYVHVRHLRRTSTVPLTTKRKVRMAKRIFFLLATLALGSVSGVILRSLHPPADYQMRVYYVGTLVTSFLILLCRFAFTPPVKEWLVERANKRKRLNSNRIINQHGSRGPDSKEV